MGEPYREGHEYVVCDECGSHILIDVETRRLGFDPDDDLPEKWIGFTCDNDECEADCSALIANPYLEPQPLVFAGETGEDACRPSIANEADMAASAAAAQTAVDVFAFLGGRDQCPAPRPRTR
jgi:hypothetical protein